MTKTQERARHVCNVPVDRYIRASLISQTLGLNNNNNNNNNIWTFSLNGTETAVVPRTFIILFLKDNGDASAAAFGTRTRCSFFFFPFRGAPKRFRLDKYRSDWKRAYHGHFTVGTRCCYIRVVIADGGYFGAGPGSLLGATEFL